MRPPNRSGNGWALNAAVNVPSSDHASSTCTYTLRGKSIGDSAALVSLCNQLRRDIVQRAPSSRSSHFAHITRCFWFDLVHAASEGLKDEGAAPSAAEW